jgi:hypothetical protein
VRDDREREMHRGTRSRAGTVALIGAIAVIVSGCGDTDASSAAEVSPAGVQEGHSTSSSGEPTDRPFPPRGPCLLYLRRRLRRRSSLFHRHRRVYGRPLPPATRVRCLVPLRHPLQHRSPPRLLLRRRARPRLRHLHLHLHLPGLPEVAISPSTRRRATASRPRRWPGTWSSCSARSAKTTTRRRTRSATDLRTALCAQTIRSAR